MRILIVEDEVKLAHAIKKALTTQQYAVDMVTSGKDGYDLARGESFDLIILDIMLPEMDGIELCRRLREDNIHTPIIMLTARGEILDKVTGLDVGADDYLVKPFSFEELFARIRALLRRPSKTDSAVLSLSDLNLDPVSFTVTRKGMPIVLSRKEFSILEYLLRHKNMVLSKDQIVNHVWNYDADILSSTVEVHMKHLRDKVDKPFFHPLIHTIRGFGYTIREEK